eukprot:GFKZ01003155.1.p1 GENE.GFKZ01003155.1~~GFKZ01003155.1.p1  ORF type:complete len:507 (+),score=51.75 GFKZ01003155.1:138-1658(+)
MYTTATDAEGPYFLFTDPTIFLHNIPSGGGIGVISFLTPYFRVPRLSSRDDLLRDIDPIKITREALIVSVLVLLTVLLSEALTLSLILSAPHGTVSPLFVCLHRFVYNFRHFRFNHLVARKDKHDADDQASRKSLRKNWVLGALVVTLLLIFQFTVISFSYRSTYKVYNSELAFGLLQPINPHWPAVWSASARQLNQPCVAVNIFNGGSTGTRINNCVTSTLSANQFESYEQVQHDSVRDASIVSEIHVYGSDHVLTIDGESVEFVARSYFSLDDLQERIMRQRSPLERNDAQIALVHRQFFAYLFSSYVRRTGDSSLSLERLQELQVDSVPPRNSSVRGISQTDRGTEVFETPSIRYETRVSGIMPRGLAALRFGQSFFKGMIGVGLVSSDVSDFFAGIGVAEAESLVWSEWRRRLNWLALLVINACLAVAVIIIRIWLRSADELDSTRDGIHGGAASATLMEAREDDGEAEFRDRSKRLRSLGTGIGSNRDLATSEYPVAANRQ